jgi:hypothetical protein
LKTAQEQTVGAVQFLQELRVLTARVALATLAVHIVGRRRLIRLILAPGVVVQREHVLGATQVCRHPGTHVVQEQHFVGAASVIGRRGRASRRV